VHVDMLQHLMGYSFADVTLMVFSFLGSLLLC